MNPEKLRIVRSPKRKNAAVYILEEGLVELRLPQRFPERKIPSLLEEYRAWIEKKMAEVNELQVPQKKFCAGEEFFILGSSATLCLTNATSKIFFKGDGLWAPDWEKPVLKKRLETWYRAKAKEVFQRRRNHFEKQMGLEARSLQVREYTARWGTCFPDGKIALNWRLIMAPLEVIDYVIIHELAHLRYNGHGKAFWRLVEKHCPEYKKKIKELRIWSHELFSF